MVRYYALPMGRIPRAAAQPDCGGASIMKPGRVP